MHELIDVHSHLDHPIIIGKTDEIIRRAKLIGLKRIITNGINPETNRICLQLSKKYEIVKCAMGIYPRDALRKETQDGEYPLKFEDFSVDEEIDFIRKNAKSIVAISEVGLDFVDGKSNEQIMDFEKMIKLAQELGKAIVVHSRKAEEDCINILQKHGMKNIVMHCFCGKKSLVKRILDNGWSLSIPTNVVRSQQFQDIIKLAPLRQLLCETDSPYLSPYKGQWNEPSYVIESYNKIAEIKNISIGDVADSIRKNFDSMFGKK